MNGNKSIGNNFVDKRDFEKEPGVLQNVFTHIRQKLAATDSLALN